MKPTGFVKKIDEMGRIVIPKNVRKTIGAEIGDSLQFFIDGDNIIMKKFSVSCAFCGISAPAPPARGYAPSCP